VYLSVRIGEAMFKLREITGLILCILVSCCLVSGCTSTPAPQHKTMTDQGMLLSGDSSDFVLLAEAVPDAILEIRYYSTYNFVGDRIKGYEQPVALLTKEAAEKLKKASDKLDSMEYRIKIWDSYRPQRAVDHFMRWGKNESDDKMKKYFYPDLTKKEVFEGGYVATQSGHSRGSTLDITLLHKINGTDVDFGSGFDYFGELAHFNYTGVTEEQKNNRILLNKIMVESGFEALPEEWWHFTLKNEPYPKTYFNFPVNSTLLRIGIKK
jgi:D-alanyl-D-alanine dipeptidase